MKINTPRYVDEEEEIEDNKLDISESSSLEDIMINNEEMEEDSDQTISEILSIKEVLKDNTDSNYSEASEDCYSAESDEEGLGRLQIVKVIYMPVTEIN